MTMLDNFGRLLQASKPLICLIVLVSISACGATPKRDCPAFYHPDANAWLPGSVGSIYRFTDKMGNLDEYEIESVTLNDPHVGTLRYARHLESKHVTCELTRNVRMMSTDKSRGFEFAFRHKEILLDAIENHWFTLYITPLSIGNSENVETQRLDFNISKPTNRANRAEYFTYHPNQVVNDKEYSDVLLKSAYGTTKVKPTPFLMNRIVLSKGHGLIQFRLVDNTEFNIVSTEF